MDEQTETQIIKPIDTTTITGQQEATAIINLAVFGTVLPPHLVPAMNLYLVENWSLVWNLLNGIGDISYDADFDDNAAIDIYEKMEKVFSSEVWLRPQIEVQKEALDTVLQWINGIGLR